MLIRSLFLFAFWMAALSASAQQDTLILEGGNYLAGTLKEMSRGVASFKTDYSDSNFKVKWKKVDSVNTESSYLIFVYPDQRYNGRIIQSGKNTVDLIQETDTIRDILLNEIVYLKEVRSNFLNKLSAEVGMGFNFTKAQRMSEYNVRSEIAYRSEHWNGSVRYDDIRSTRIDATTVERMEASVNHQYILENNWFTVSQISLYSNSEQSINLRTLAKLGIGKRALMSRNLYWTIEGGITYNNENFKTSSDKNFKNSMEAFLGSRLNIYDYQNFSLLLEATTYPSITTSRRFRFDFSADLKYDLPLNLFIKLGYALNHDNKPVNGAQSTDYIFQTTIGWGFN